MSEPVQPVRAIASTLDQAARRALATEQLSADLTLADAYEVIWGRLTDAIVVEDGAVADVGRFIHPRVEPGARVRLEIERLGSVGFSLTHATKEEE